MGTMSEDTPVSALFKGIIVADSGFGKSGGLASLVDAGWKLRVLDFDSRFQDMMMGYVKKRENLKNVSYITLRDEFKIEGAGLKIAKAPAFQKAMNMMNKWDDGDVDYGPVSSWGPDVILVVDTLSNMGRASLNMVLQANANLGGNATQPQWGTAMENIDRFLLNATNDKLVPCHLIVNTHKVILEGEEGRVAAAYPESLGKRLNPKVARNFNNMLGLTRRAGISEYQTKKDGLLALKTMKPMKKESYPLETGLATIFEELVGPPPSAA